MNIEDRGNKLVLRDTLRGEERTVGFMEYRTHPDEKRVVIGVTESLPHLDPIDTGIEFLTVLREKYPRPDWSLETEPQWCGGNYSAVIAEIESRGHDFFDFVGQTVGGTPTLTEDWDFDGIIGADTKSPATTSLWPVMERLDSEADGD